MSSGRETAVTGNGRETAVTCSGRETARYVWDAGDSVGPTAEGADLDGKMALKASGLGYR